ncbi:MAG: PQQ-binding-like beta-propeller repeat protein [Lentisphaerales bacterium]|nr:PQQ-binding-like beta-propeller repeat protein [Lentisphaerales bacterium]
MNLRFSIKSALLSTALLMTGCQAQELSSTGENWPMSGGPDGTWTVKTNSPVPTKWSVRNTHNIKWKTALPAGGQSGIAVWEDKLFLTINPPMDTPVFAESKANFEEYSKAYNQLIAKIEKEKASHPDFQKVKSAQDSATKAWNDLLKNDKKYTKARGGHKRKLLSAMKKSDIGKVYTSATGVYQKYLHKQSAELVNLFIKRNTAEKDMNTRGNDKDIFVYCLNSSTGEILWNKKVPGMMSSGYNYGFSDSTTPCPATDGENVWVINSSGGMACFSMDGELVWERTWMPTGGRPFNKQYDSILFENLILNVEPPLAEDKDLVEKWNYLHAFDKKTGKRLWVNKDSLTHYNAPVIGETADGKMAVMIARGGPHGVPERPVGLSLVSLEKENQGQSLWQWEPEKDDNGHYGWGALSNQVWDKETVSWFTKTGHVSVDSKTGKTIVEHTMGEFTKYDYDSGSKSFKKSKGAFKIEGQRHCNVMVGDDIYYLGRYQPYIVHHNVKSGAYSVVEVPTELTADGQPIWRGKHSNDTANSKGQVHGPDSRTRGDGFQKCFPGAPVVINGLIYFTSPLGITYVVDSKKDFGPDAVVAVNDLGKQGQTWTVGSPSFANGKLYHRTLKEVICIGR